MAEDKPTSGSRWEPGADDETAPIARPAVPADAPTEGSTAAHEAVTPEEPQPAEPGRRDLLASARGRLRGTRGVGVLVAAAALLLGGIGGYAVAKALDGQNNGGQQSDVPGRGPQGDDHGGRPDGPGGGFGHGDGGGPGGSGTGDTNGDGA